MPSNEDILVSESDDIIKITEDFDLSAELSGWYYGYGGYFVVDIIFTGTMQLRITTKYKTIQNRRKTIYSNIPKAKFNPGNITINYKKETSNYTTSSGTLESIQYFPSSKINTINISLDLDNLKIPKPLYLYEILESEFNISKLPFALHAIHLGAPSGIDDLIIDWPLPISISMYALVESGSGGTIGLNKNIEASGYINYP